MASERCQDEALWLVTYNVALRRKGRVFIAAAAHAESDKYPLTKTLILYGESRFR
jgi:hypothetical protein